MSSLLLSQKYVRNPQLCSRDEKLPSPWRERVRVRGK
jgi:hypothetical protein